MLLLANMGTKGEHGEEHKAEHSAGHEHEVELGKFNVIVHKPAENLTMRVNFHLIGTVGEKEHKEFEELYRQMRASPAGPNHL